MSVKKSTVFILVSLLIFFLRFSPALCQADKSHFSKVFNREKPYRIFLPSDYATSMRHYPVIYFFHGNTGSHELDIPGVAQLVNDNNVILVAWNGRSADDDLRPYNIGNHSNIKYQVQFKDYFPELVNHIDSTYRTLKDRSNRAVIGHSMGGIMAFFIAGKYPQMIGSAFSSKGSPEFFIGYPDNHSLYHVRYMFKNLYGVRVKFATSTECELYYLNNEVIQGAMREKGLDFSYNVYEGNHDITPEQFKDAFDFIVASFKSPVPDPVRWHHADLYPGFDIWGYEIRSDLDKRGFIDMRGVTKGGLGIAVKAWEPDGVIIPGVTISVRTPARYTPKTSYTLLDYNITKDQKNISIVTSDANGKISFPVNHENHQIGIYRKGDPPEITYVSHRVNDKGIFLDHKKECRLGIRLLNRGGSAANGIRVNLSTSNEDVVIANPEVDFEKLPSGELIWLPVDFKVIASNRPATDGSPFRIRFNLTITDNKKHIWNDEFDAPVYYDLPEFTEIGIDDGDSEIFGSGNGNNIAEPGETVMIYEISTGSRRLRLYHDDQYIDSERLYDEIQPDKWGDGYSLSSLIHISKDCPPGHQIRFLASYEVKDWKKIRRDVTWGTFTITIGDPRATDSGQNLEQIHSPVFVGRPTDNAFNGLVRLPDGELRHYGYTGNQANPSQYVYISSKDNGLTWDRNIISDTSLFTSENMPPASCSPYSGDFIRLISTGAGTFVLRSSTGIDGPYQKIQIDSAPHDMIRQPLYLKSKKRMLVTCGRSLILDGNGVMQSCVYYSDDDGLTWNISYVPVGPRFVTSWPHKKSRWQNYAIEPTIAELENGTIWMLLRTSQDQLYESFSSDKGTTWSEPKPSRFYSTLTMPAFYRLKDGRLLLFFNNTSPLPEEDRTGDLSLRDEQKTGETWEDVFTNRDVLHAAISDDDGKTWTGFRELYLNPLRNEHDFALSGGKDVSLDKSVHQSQAVELPGGKVLVAFGQHPLVRAMVIFDPVWLYETERSDNFTAGLKNWSTFSYIDGIKGHCAYNRDAGPSLIDHPGKNGNKVLNIRHVLNKELVCDVDGAVWNFPAALKGSLTTRIMLKPGGKGGRISLIDRWFNPTDTLAYRYAVYTLRLSGDDKNKSESILKQGKWVELRFEWDNLQSGSCRLLIDNKPFPHPLHINLKSTNGINYVHFQSVSDDEDTEGYLIESVKAVVASK